MMEEEFRPIPGHPRYGITKDGKIKNLKYNREIRPSIMKVGYYGFTISEKMVRTTIKVHRALMLTYRPSLYPNDLVFHKDGNKLNNSLDNLVWASELYDIPDSDFYIIPGSKIYEITRNGIVRNKVTRQLIFPAIDRLGYRRMHVDDRNQYLHRLLLTTFVPNPNNYPCVNHIDANPANNSLDNLEWCTHSMNTLHAYKIGTKTNVGTKNPAAKINEDDVREIKKLSALGGKTRKEIADLFNVSVSVIKSIRSGRNWSHVA